MDSSTAILLAGAAVVAAAAVIAWLFSRKRRTESLRSRFGPEYDRAVAAAGDPRRAEARLVDRTRRVARLELRAVPEAERARFAERWKKTQAQFVDDPTGAIADGEVLIKEIMKARGYPVGDFEQRAADLSVDHAAVVQNYRAAREIAARNRRGQASTEDLRQALVYDRDLFEELLESPVAIHQKEASHG
jgi:hypothetical protein